MLLSRNQGCCSDRDRNSRCNGEIGSRQWADFSHLLSFLQSNLLTGSLLFLLFILWKEIKKEIRSERWIKRASAETQMSKKERLHFEMLNNQTLVNSCALARLSTAIAKNTFSRVSECKVKSNAVLLVCEYTACPLFKKRKKWLIHLHYIILGRFINWIAREPRRSEQHVIHTRVTSLTLISDFHE